MVVFNFGERILLMNWKTPIALIAICAGCFLVAPAESRAADLEDCVRGILLGNEVKGAKIGRHDFNCKPVSVYKHAFNDGELTFSGNLSHRLSGRPDDQMSYIFDLEENGDVRDFDVSVTSRGGISGLIDSNAFTSIVLSPISTISKKSMTAKLNEAGWNEAATVIAGTIAATMQDSQINARRNRNRGSLEWMIDRPGNDYKRALFAASARPESCQNICKNDVRCRAWTFVPAGIQENNRAVCWLKDRIPAARTKARIVSGIRAGAGSAQGDRDIGPAPTLTDEAPSARVVVGGDQTDAGDDSPAQGSATDNEDICCFEEYGPTEYATRAVCTKRKGKVVATDRCEPGDAQSGPSPGALYKFQCDADSCRCGGIGGLYGSCSGMQSFCEGTLGTTNYKCNEFSLSDDTVVTTCHCSVE